MKKSTFLCSFIFFISVVICAQEKDTDVKELPVSIYTFNSLSKGLNSLTSINKKINSKNLHSIFIDVVDVDVYQYSIDVKNINKNSSDFIYNDLRRYQDRKIIKDFILEHDPISWSLHNNLQHALPPID